ncbi:hypothetical protein [Gimesia algae]|uniref:Carboxypeptidase regulatory-like domain-containing protein n=1 Tax=Gimesia algae TaxID=2527971 RepID=A0A517VKF9_9PLAN|nr:hypothetical protein [Gimesia algae]QDT93506.1 hypothetical protein Pan161_51860 [Gimesia algae]
MSNRSGLLLSLGMLLCFGCGQPDDRLPTARVTGTVAFDGKPLTSGNIMFFPVSGGKHAVGMIGDDGAFHLSTYESGDGAIPGEHKVVIQVSHGSPDGTAVPQKTPRIPVKYSQRNTTTLIAEITAEGENQLNLNVLP